MLYNITVYTTDRDKAGTDAQVYIVMHGQTASSSQIFLKNGKFERASIDKFAVYAPVTLSPLTALNIGHDNTGLEPGWFLDKVNSNFWIFCNRYKFEDLRWLFIVREKVSNKLSFATIG